ncbi:MAG: outer membrane protein transport protein [Oceanicaulis sp.]
MRSILPRIAARAGFAAALSLTAAAPALADGFKLSEYSSRDFGMANAGYAALAADPSTIWSNPAGLTRLEDWQVNLGAYYIYGRGEFENDGSTGPFGQPLTGTEEDDLFNDEVIPNLYVSAPVSERVTLGLGVNAPFGLSTQYEPSSLTRFQAVKSSLRVVDINPAIGFQLNDQLSFGLGVSAQYADATLANNINFTAACLSQAPAAACTSAGLAPQTSEGFVRVKGDDWSYGWNAGVLFEPEEGTRVGFSYRSEVNHELGGEAEFGTPPGAAIFAPAFTDTAASAPLDLPSEAAVSLRHEVNGAFAWNATVRASFWDLDALVVAFDNPAQPASRETLGYQTAVKASFGVEYAPRPDWVLRAGLAYDESPADEDDRTARVPDTDRVVAALGASWTPSEAFSVDLGYQHLFFDDAPINHVGSGGDRLVGEFDNTADLFGLGLTWRR